MVELLPFFLLTLYLAPFLAAAARGRDGIGLILVANLLVGWTEARTATRTTASS